MYWAKQIIYKGDILMPFAGFENWDECISKMIKKYTKEQSEKICGKLKSQHEGKDSSAFNLMFVEEFLQEMKEDEGESILNPQEIKAGTPQAGKVWVDPKCTQKLIALGFNPNDARVICATKQINLDTVSVPQDFQIKTIYKQKHKPKKKVKAKVETLEEKRKRKEKEKAKIEEIHARRLPEEKRKLGLPKAEAQTRTHFSPEKRGGQSLPLEVPMRPPKSQNKLQVKMEKVQTEEEKFKTQEELARRATYARVVKKRDAFVHDSIDVGNYNRLNNVTKVVVTLAKEMIQPYYGGKARHFKPFTELARAIINLDSLPIIIEHIDYGPDDIIGYVKEFWADEKDRSIKGYAYITDSKLPSALLAMIKLGSPIPVSIGFWADLGPAGAWGGQPYDAFQKNITLDHLAVVVKSNARCGVDDGCGFNIDSINPEHLIYDAFKNVHEYYLINKDTILENSVISEEKSIDNLLANTGDNMENQNTDADVEITSLIYNDKEYVLQEEEKTEDAQFGKQKHKSDETGDDLEALLTRLWKFIGGIAAPEAKNEVIRRIKSAMSNFEAHGSGSGKDSETKDSQKDEVINMDEKEFEEKLAVKDAALDEMKADNQKLADALKEYEEREVKNLISTIKKFGKYEDAELEGKCVKELRVIADAVSRFDPSNEKAKKLPKDVTTDSKVPSTQKGSQVFAEINKGFVM